MYLKKPPHDQKQICVQSEHTHAQFAHMPMLGLGAVFFSIEAMIPSAPLLSAMCISY